MIDIAERLEDGLLRSALRGIRPADEEAAARCRARWNCIAKPLYGLGVLEDLVVRIAAAQGTDQVDISRKGLVVFCADNGPDWTGSDSHRGGKFHRREILYRDHV